MKSSSSNARRRASSAVATTGAASGAREAGRGGPRRRRSPKVPYVLDADGKKVSLDSLPLAAYRLTCGHLGKQSGVQVRDVILCPQCGTNKTIKTIIAQ